MKKRKSQQLLEAARGKRPVGQRFNLGETRRPNPLTRGSIGARFASSRLETNTTGNKRAGQKFSTEKTDGGNEVHVYENGERVFVRKQPKASLSNPQATTKVGSDGLNRTGGAQAPDRLNAQMLAKARERALRRKRRSRPVSGGSSDG